MSTLTLCEDQECYVPITDATKHRIYSTFCKPCGRKQRGAKSPSGGKVRNRTSPNGHKFVLNDKDAFVSDENSDWAFRREDGRFSLYYKGLKIINQTTLWDIMNSVDIWWNTPDDAYRRNHYVRRDGPYKVLYEKYVAPWIEYDILGTRDDQPFSKSMLKTDAQKLLDKRKNDCNVTLEEVVVATVDNNYLYLRLY